MKERRHPSDIKLSCPVCTTTFYTASREVRRQEKKGREVFYCSSKCAAEVGNRKTFGVFLSETTRQCEFCSSNYTPNTSRQRYCGASCTTSARWADEDFREKTCVAIKRWIDEHPEENAEIRARQMITLSDKEKQRFSSKAERALGDILEPLGFKRHKRITSGLERNFDVDMHLTMEDRAIWVESDGPYHFRKVHRNHDFEKSKRRDEIEELYVADKPILLLRVANEKYTLDEQVEFVKASMAGWDGSPCIKKLY